MKPLPTSLDNVQGLRVAQWARESTRDQGEMEGPGSQRDAIQGAIERYGLIDTGLSWQVTASGWRRAWLTPEWAEMLTCAKRGEFDLLVVSYFSRLLRNVKQALMALDELHALGVAIFAVDERLLSSDDSQWHAYVEEATDAEKFSWRMGRRMKEGHAARRRRGEPGGHAPFGFTRTRDADNRPTYLIEVPDHIAVVRQVYGLSASGMTDRDVAYRTGLRKSHVSELLTNPIYRGQLRNGATRPAVIDSAVWEKVVANRSRRARRSVGPTKVRTYLLSGLAHCHACQRRLIGHSGRYRHSEACDEFRAARPPSAHHLHKGDSYPAAAYDAIVPAVLAKVSANAALIADVQASILSRTDHGPDPMAIARITREREAAAIRYVHDRDLASLDTALARLDSQEAAVQMATRSLPTPSEVAASLHQLDTLFVAAEPETRRRIALSLFSRVEVLGPSEVWAYPSDEAEAQGWGAAFTGVTRATVRQIGRGESVRVQDIGDN